MQMNDREVLQALQTQEDALEQMPQINAHYQDIEILTGGNLDNATQTDLIERLKKIREINGRIGQITKEWI